MRLVNFGFLGFQESHLVAQADGYFCSYPNMCFNELQQLGEVLMQLVATQMVLFTSPHELQVELLRRLRYERVLPAEISEQSLVHGS